jgi:hypothetical protein
MRKHECQMPAIHSRRKPTEQHRAQRVHGHVAAALVKGTVGGGFAVHITADPASLLWRLHLCVSLERHKARVAWDESEMECETCVML